MKKLNFVFFAICVAIFFSCEFGGPGYVVSYSDVETRAKKIKILLGDDLPQITKSANDASFSNSKYSFIVLTDMHFGTNNIERNEERFLKKFEELLCCKDESFCPRFIVNLGDTNNAGKKANAHDFKKVCDIWIEKAKKILGVTDFKVYSILGNHDLYNNGWEVWKKNIWPYVSYYKFFLRASDEKKIGFENAGFSFYFLDAANGTLGANQIKDLEKNFLQDSSYKIVFMHYPLFANGQFYFALPDSTERNKMIAIFAKGNVKFFFAGHTHHYDFCDFKKFSEAVVPSYAYEKKFMLVTVDEKKGDVNYKIFDY